MLIRFLQGPKKNQTVHVPRNDSSVALLIGAGLAEEVPNAAPAGQPDRHDTVISRYDTPVWSIARVTTTNRPIIQKLFGLSETSRWADWDDQGPKPVIEAAQKAGAPKEILAQYLAAYQAWRK